MLPMNIGSAPVRRRSLLLLVLTVLATSCSLRNGVVSGAVPPPDGAQLARDVVERITAARQALPLAPAPRDAALDELAVQGVRRIEAGLPDQVSAIEHINGMPGLPDDVELGVGFEDATPGLDDRLREAGSRRGGQTLSEQLLAADPALTGIGQAGGGPWAVVVFRSRPLVPGDVPALQAALEGGVQRARPNLRSEPALTLLASDAVADGKLDDFDEAHFSRTGGTPVTVRRVRTGPHLPTTALSFALEAKDPGVLRETWLETVGVAVTVTDTGTMSFVVLSSGKADRSALDAELAAAETRATDLVNRSRAEAALPPVTLDPVLAVAARRWATDAGRRGCYPGFGGLRSCSGDPPPVGDYFYFDQSTWSGGESPFTWDLTERTPGDEQLRRFGAAAVLAPDGTVWSMLALAT